MCIIIKNAKQSFLERVMLKKRPSHFILTREPAMTRLSPLNAMSNF